MPKQYEKIRNRLISKGTPTKEAKRIAAATYNKQHPGNPMRPHKKDRRETHYY